MLLCRDQDPVFLLALPAGAGRFDVGAAVRERFRQGALRDSAIRFGSVVASPSMLSDPQAATGTREEVLDDHLRVLGDAALVRQRVLGEQRAWSGRPPPRRGFLVTSFRYVSYAP